jgi:triphosphoribosyl-dephospho-CoA synthase
MTPGNGLLVQTACIWEATARKVGNVHPTASFADMEYVDFLLSAAVLGKEMEFSLFPVLGLQIYRSFEATHNLVKKNTNLGIVLLLTPLALAPRDKSWRDGLQSVFEWQRVEDAQYAFAAIRLANPGGLGDAPEQDVRNEPTVTLLEAMKLAADRDMVARQYANGFADVFDFGVPAFLTGFERFGCVEAGIIDSQLRWLAEYPDSLIARKNGPAVAEDVRKRAAEVLILGGIATPEGRRAGVALDRHLRSDGNKLNPGTIADLITACLFVALRENKVSPAAPFRWQVPDWL